MRVYDVNYFMNLNFIYGIEFLNYAFKKETERLYWDVWICDRQNMSKQNFKPFKDYYDINEESYDIDTRPKELILKELKEFFRKEGKDGTV